MLTRQYVCFGVLSQAGIIRKTVEKLARQDCTEDFAQDGTKFLNNVSKGRDPEKLGFTLHDVPIIQARFSITAR